MQSSLPSGWESTALSNLIVFVIGGDWGKPPDYEDENYVRVRCIRASEMKRWAGARGATAALRKIKTSSLASRELKSGDIILEISGGGPEQPVGRTLLIDRSCLAINADTPKICTNFFRLVRPSDEIDSEYLNKYLQHFHAGSQIKQYQGGSNNLRNLKFQDYLTIQVPVPPLAEQRRIVAKVEELFSELDNGVESLKAARAQLQTYRQSLLKAAFEGRLTEQWRSDNADKLENADQVLKRILDEREARYQQRLEEWKEAIAQWQASDQTQPKPKKPRPANVFSSIDPKLHEHLPELPDEWSWQSIENLVEFSPNAIKAGPFGSALKKEVYARSGYKVYGQEQVISGDPFYGDYFVDSEKYSQLSACAVKPRDVLISLVGTIGKVLILPNSSPEGVINPRLVKLSLNESVYTPEFFKFYFESQFIRSLYYQVSQGTTMNVLNLGIIKWLPYPLCSEEEQREIVNLLQIRLSQASYLDEQIEEAIARCDALRQSILKRAFEGNLVPQDPDDEPASVLLERIRAEQETEPKPVKGRRKSNA